MTSTAIMPPHAGDAGTLKCEPPSITARDGSVIRLERVRCPLCDADRPRELFRRPDHWHEIADFAFPVVRCRACGMGYVSPRPVIADLQAFYPPEFYRADEGSEEVLAAKADQLRAKARFLAHLPPGRLLDIGCTKGEFLETMRRRGWTVQGTDFSRTPPNLFGLDIFYGLPEEAPFADGSFDAITLWAVLEHIYYPRRTLAAVSRMLRPGGTAVVLVPNLRSVPARWMRHDDVPRHTLMFTRATLGKLLRETGLRPTAFECSQDVFGGSLRGVMNYAVKRLHGESMASIVAQARSQHRWEEFSARLRGQPSPLMQKIDRFDIRWTPRLDRIVDRLGFGFIMVMTAVKA